MRIHKELLVRIILLIVAAEIMYRDALKDQSQKNRVQDKTMNVEAKTVQENNNSANPKGISIFLDRFASI